MSTVLAFVTSKKATALAMVMALLLWLASDGAAAQQLVEWLGLRPDRALRAVGVAKFALVILAGAGISPLKKPSDTP